MDKATAFQRKIFSYSVILMFHNEESLFSLAPAAFQPGLFALREGIKQTAFQRMSETATPSFRRNR